jgi:hypothetical protein
VAAGSSPYYFHQRILETTLIDAKKTNKHIHRNALINASVGLLTERTTMKIVGARISHTPTNRLLSLKETLGRTMVSKNVEMKTPAVQKKASF